MRYTFKDILNAELYDSTKVMFVVGKYQIFNNMVCDELRGKCLVSDNNIINSSISAEFGLVEDADANNSTSVDFNTFMEVLGVKNINGKWFCKVELNELTKTQREKLIKYLKEPSDNGILVISSTDWRDYIYFINNKSLAFSKSCHILQLSFPHRESLKIIVKQMFNDRGIEINSKAIDFFIMRMSSAYDEYENVINGILTKHYNKKLELKELKSYMKGIENYVIEDFVLEITKPMSSDKTNNKKVLRILIALEEELGAKNLVYQMIKIIDECIDFRIMINRGDIPIGLKYFYNDIVSELGEDNKYSKLNEWVFRKKADLAAQTSLRDWEYMKLILNKSIENNKIAEDLADKKCQKALYALCTRSVITSDRINNNVGIYNTLDKQRINLDKIKYDEEALRSIKSKEEIHG